MNIASCDTETLLPAVYAAADLVQLRDALNAWLDYCYRRALFSDMLPQDGKMPVFSDTPPESMRGVYSYDDTHVLLRRWVGSDAVDYRILPREILPLIPVSDPEAAMLVSLLRHHSAPAGEELYLTEHAFSAKPHKLSPRKALAVISELEKKRLVDYFDPGPSATIRITPMGVHYANLFERF